VAKETKEIICVKICEGKRHDFKLFKDYKLPIDRKIEAETDSGYQGIKSFHKNFKHPKKKPKNGELTSEEKAENRQISEKRARNWIFETFPYS
jgi:hypothetical protein